MFVDLAEGLYGKLILNKIQCFYLICKKYIFRYLIIIFTVITLYRHYGNGALNQGSHTISRLWFAYTNLALSLFYNSALRIQRSYPARNLINRKRISQVRCISIRKWFFLLCSWKFKIPTMSKLLFCFGN